MRRIRSITILSLIALVVGLGPAWAQLVVTDRATTARNAVTAVLKNRIVETLTSQRDRLERMAERLSAQTPLDRYATPGPPDWKGDPSEDLLYANGYQRALASGDSTGAEYEAIARTRQPANVNALSIAARQGLGPALATLDLADSAIVTGTHIAGQLRSIGRNELAAIAALERDVIDGSETQSATAVLDKISGAVVIEARQKQARLQYLTAVVEQLLVDNKRARDTESATMNMQLGRLRNYSDESNDRLLTGAADDLRTWRQP
jgi:hypothetical protein